ncbi:hypothetical protein CRENBAI_020123 [Crenichthys baileyi]|uniref:Uncharacterized protein n=1 Tax=Crenichthys baileyi TaxID=28760 RepID=A0AAV9SJN5_9TELE
MSLSVKVYKSHLRMHQSAGDPNQTVFSAVGLTSDQMGRPRKMQFYFFSLENYVRIQVEFLISAPVLTSSVSVMHMDLQQYFSQQLYPQNSLFSISVLCCDCVEHSESEQKQLKVSLFYT